MSTTNNVYILISSDRMKKVTLPTKMSSDLAEEIGIHIGDGSLSIRPKYRHYDYFVCLGIHEKDYMKHVLQLIQSLYRIKVKPIERTKDSSLIATISSKKLTLWKLSLGLPSGDKGQINIPKSVLDSKFILDCVRGIFDTDGSLTFKKKYKDVHYYPVIKITSKSKILISQIYDITFKLGFTVYTYFDERMKSSTGTISTEHSLFISGNKSLEMWMDLIGSRSPVHISKYLIWKKFGFCPPKTTLSIRKSILKGIADPSIFENAGRGI